MAKKIVQKVNDLIRRLMAGDTSVLKEVEYSMKKYGDTYKWLEEYDTKAYKNPEELAKPGSLRPYLRDFQKKSRVRRTDPAV